MKILHSSDWHLGKILHERSLLEDQQYVLKQIHSLLKEDPHDLLIIAGDLYDRSLPSAEATSLLSWFLTELRKISNIKVIIIPGNHDSASRLSFCSEIINQANIFFQTDLKKIDQPLSFKGKTETLDIYALPFFNPFSFQTHQEGEEEKILNQEEALQKALSLISPKINSQNINLLIAHLFVQGGEESDSERKFIGSLGEVKATLLNDFDYVALGHLHRPQKINDKIFYSGSLLKYSFSESSDQKQVLSIDLTKRKKKITPFFLKPKRDLLKLKGSFFDLLNNEELKKYKNDFLEIELIDSSLILNPLALLKKRFPYLLAVKQNLPKGSSGEERIKLLTKTRNIEEDFLAFHKFLYGEKPSPKKMEIFHSFSKDLNDETSLS